jgi:hypothetical protein
VPSDRGPITEIGLVLLERFPQGVGENRPRVNHQT